VITSPDDEPPVSLTPGQLLDARHVLDDQTFDALDDQHRRLAARVEGLEAVVNMLERLLLRSPALPEVPGATRKEPESARPPGTRPGQDGGAGGE
jgi:hypothetical protein